VCRRRARRPAADAHATARLYIDLADRIVRPVLDCSFSTATKCCFISFI
jgi:hypothetical protein